MWTDFMGSRTTSFTTSVASGRVVDEGTCAIGYTQGTGFLTGYGTGVQAHHTDIDDQPTETWRFGLPTTFDGFDEPYTRKRLYALGFLGWADPSLTLNDLEYQREIKNWEFHRIEDWYSQHEVDAVLERIPSPRCLEATDELGVLRAPLYGPGIFYDWLRPDAELMPETDQPVFGLHINSEGEEFPPSTEVFLEPEFLIFTDETMPPPADIHHLISLPGYYGGPEDCAEATVGCDDGQWVTIDDYQGCSSTSIDARQPSSGGPMVLADSSTDSTKVWGLIQGGRAEDGNPQNWNRADPNAPEYPDGVSYTSITRFNQDMVDDIKSGNNQGGGQGSGSTPATGPDPLDIETRPAYEDELYQSTCTGDGCNPEGGVGPGGGETTIVSCRQMYQTFGHDWPGMGIGVTGGPWDLDEGAGIVSVGSFGIVCAPWSAWSWTNFWHYVGYIGREALGSRLRGFQSILDMPLSRALVQQFVRPGPEDPHDETARPVGYEPRPFQNCPSGFYLDGITFLVDRDDGSILGVKDIVCANLNDDPSINGGEPFKVIPLAELYTAGNDEPHEIYQAIGDPLAHHDDWLDALEAYVTCDISGAHITGFELSVTDSSPLTHVRILCTQRPPKLNEAQCDENGNAVIPSGAPLFNP